MSTAILLNLILLFITILSVLMVGSVLALFGMVATSQREVKITIGPGFFVAVSWLVTVSIAACLGYLPLT